MLNSYVGRSSVATMRYLDIPDNQFEKVYHWLVTGESLKVRIAVTKSFLEKNCESKKFFSVGFIGDNESFINHVSKDCGLKRIASNIDKLVLNHFTIWEWNYLIEHYYTDSRAEDTKAYVRFMFELRKCVSKDALLLDLCDELATVQGAMSLFASLRNQKYPISTEEYEMLKVKYLEVMSAATYFEEIINQIDNMQIEKVSSKRQRIIYWCVVRKQILFLEDESIPIIINYIDGDEQKIIYELLVDFRSKKILLISNDILRYSSSQELLSCFELAVFSRTSFMPSAKMVEELFGSTKTSKTTLSESYDCRIGKERWVDKLLQTNKTKTISTHYEYEPLFPKEEICSLVDEMALYRCFAEGGYVRVTEDEIV